MLNVSKLKDVAIFQMRLGDIIIKDYKNVSLFTNDNFNSQNNKVIIEMFLHFLRGNEVLSVESDVSCYFYP